MLGSELDLKALLPLSIVDDEEMRNIADAVSAVIREHFADPRFHFTLGIGGGDELGIGGGDELGISKGVPSTGYIRGVLLYHHLEEQPHEVLDSLAEQWSVVHWRDGWSRERKISVLRTAIPNQYTLGSVRAVEDAVKALGQDVEIVEWWQESPAGTPHTFTILVSTESGAPTPEDIEEARAAISLAKPKRSGYDIVLTSGLEGNVFVGGGETSFSLSRIGYKDW